MTATRDRDSRILHHVRGLRDEFVDYVSALCRIESPTDRPETQARVHAVLGPSFQDLGYDVRIVPGRTSGDHFLAVPRRRPRQGRQLLVGHSDTVWPVDTLEHMPVRLEGGRLHGPGTLDMKGGVALMVFALRTLRQLELEPPLAPVVFINADEEVGSPDSKRHMRRLARRVDRALVLEPALGPRGLIKTARKGVGQFHVRIRGRASHAGLDPESGASAIQELSHVIQALHGLTDPQRGTTVNVGVVRGGTRANVVAADATAIVDLRVTSAEEGRRLEESIGSLRPRTPGVSLEITGGMRAAPLERTPRNRRLWSQAREAGVSLGLTLDETLAGGGSDGNTTSLYTATLDGLGCVGDGAHADHEHIEVDPSLERCALLARLLLTPLDAGP